MKKIIRRGRSVKSPKQKVAEKIIFFKQVGTVGKILFSLAGFSAAIEILSNYGAVDWEPVSFRNIGKFYCWDEKIRSFLSLAIFSFLGMFLYFIQMVAIFSLTERNRNE